MKFSTKDIVDVAKLLAYGVGSRALGFLIVFLLARNLSIDHFAWWQLGKTASGYVLTVMEAGFFFHIALLIQRDGFSMASVRAQNYKHRMEIALFATPFFFVYMHFTSTPFWYALLFIPFFIVSIPDYDGFVVAANKSVDTGKARLLKNCLMLLIVSSIGNFYDFAATPIFAATIGAAGSALLLHRVATKSEEFLNGRIYKRPLLASLFESKHFLIMQITQTSMQSADLMIAGLFLATKDVAHYSVALLIAELAIFPTYMIQRVIQARYIRQPNAHIALKLGLTAALANMLLHLLHYEFLLPIYTLLFPKFDQTLLHHLVNVLLTYVTIRTVNTYIQLHMNSTDRGRQVSTATTLGAGTNIASNLALIPSIGLSAIPWITVVSEIVIFFSLTISIWKSRQNDVSKI